MEIGGATASMGTYARMRRVCMYVHIISKIISKFKLAFVEFRLVQVAVEHHPAVEINYEQQTTYP